MRQIKLKSLVDYSQIMASATFTLTTQDAETIADNTYSWNSTYNAFRINDASAALKGSIHIPISNAYIGDVIDIKAEIMNVSGEKAKIAMDYSDASNEFILAAEGSGKFEEIGGKFLVTKNLSITIVIGTFTGNIGDNYIRNVTIKTVNPYRKSIRHYTLLSGASSFNVQTDYGEDSCTLSVNSTQVSVTHKIPFASYKNGFARGDVSATNDGKYIIKCKTEIPASFIFKIYDMTAQAYIDPTSLYGQNIWINLVAYGYDPEDIYKI